MWQVGQAGGGRLSLECIGGYLQADAGETGIFREAVPPGWADGAYGQQEQGSCRAVWLKGGSRAPQSLGPEN